MGSSSDFKECFVCGAQVPLKAIKCTQCGSYQNRWRNAAVQIGTYTGVLTLIASALTYALTTIGQSYRNQDPIQIASFSFVQGGMFINISDKPVYLDEMLVLSNDRLDKIQIRQIAKPQEFTKYLEPLGLELEHPERQAEEVWQRAWEHKDQCLRVDFQYPYKSGRRAVATLFFLWSNDAQRKEKNFELEAVLIPKAQNPCKLESGIYR